MSQVLLHEVILEMKSQGIVSPEETEERDLGNMALMVLSRFRKLPLSD